MVEGVNQGIGLFSNLFLSVCVWEGLLIAMHIFPFVMDSYQASLVINLVHLIRSMRIKLTIRFTC